MDDNISDSIGNKSMDPSGGDLQPQNANCRLLLSLIKYDRFLDLKDIRGLDQEIFLLWHHKTNLAVDPEWMPFASFILPSSHFRKNI